MTGTSMASPYALNLILKLADAFPKISPVDLKYIFMYSAYIPNITKPFPCASGGMVFPRRAYAVANLVSKDGLSLKKAALRLRQNPDFLLPGELKDQKALDRLQALWADRIR